MMQQYFDDLIAGIENKLRTDPQSASPRKRYALEIARLGRRLYSETERIAWCGVAAPFDLLAAMGVTSCFVEFIGAMLASTGMAGAFLEAAEQKGFAGDTCGYHRSVMGAAQEGLMPKPDFLIATTCPCTGGLAIMENLAHHFQKDLFVLDVPQQATAASVRYLADQIKAMEAFVSDHTGNQLTVDRLAEALVYTNQAREHMLGAYRLAQTVPSPANGQDLNNFGIVMPLFLGTRAGVEVARAFEEAFTARCDAGISGVPDEGLRLMWIQNRIQFKNDVVKRLETQFKAVIVIDELNSITWEPIDPQDPYTGLARRIISLPLNGPVQRRVEHLQNLAAAYRVDGAINPCHWGCRQGTGARGIIAQGLKAIGVPVLNLEVDCVDARNFGQGQVNTRLEAFAEMLAGKPSPWDDSG
jgi:benzoyl-CoA reductase/2-hydroxyglutaryl-CoA dehydratase subunit BcrC/BadD/HgdB